MRDFLALLVVVVVSTTQVACKKGEGEAKAPADAKHADAARGSEQATLEPRNRNRRRWIDCQVKRSNWR